MSFEKMSQGLGRRFSQVHGEMNSDPRKPSKKDRPGNVCLYPTRVKVRQIHETHWPVSLAASVASNPERDAASQTKIERN